MSSVICFGEVLLRLSPPSSRRFAQADGFDAVYGGAEANTAAALAGFGIPAAVVTKLPPHEIGDACLSALRARGIDTSHVLRGGDRLGVYFLEKGASQRPSKVIYDRRGSSIATAKREEFDWEAILADADGFFFTGITPAVGEALPQAVRDALDVCRAKGIPAACDVNYRPTLWEAERAGEVMRPLVKGLDTLIVNEEHAALLLGVSSDRQGADEDERLPDIAARLARTYALRRVALTLRRSETADDNLVSAALYDAPSGEYRRARWIRVHIVDRVGGGDAFTAGLLYGQRRGMSVAETVEFANAANAFKHSIPGDMLLASADEIARLAQSDGTVRMVR
ncbi:MAG: sugar kinase [Clostridia bacterium]|nr:sugar kinase [Clostridia bacterium]